MRTDKGTDNNKIVKSSKGGFASFLSSIFSRKDKKIDYEILRKAFQDIKTEFDDHRETINYNTNEIQSNYEYLAKLDSKMQKMDEKLDELMCFASMHKNSPVYTNALRQNSVEDEVAFENINLTTKEKEVFLIIYTSSNHITYKEIAKRTGLSQNLVACYVKNLVSKGVPLFKNYSSDMEVAIDMDPLFKEIQAKNNIVGINERVSKTSF